jgi:hypothetical protein
VNRLSRATRKLLVVLLKVFALSCLAVFLANVVAEVNFQTFFGKSVMSLTIPDVLNQGFWLTVVIFAVVAIRVELGGRKP